MTSTPSFDLYDLLLRRADSFQKGLIDSELLYSCSYPLGGLRSIMLGEELRYFLGSVNS